MVWSVTLLAMKIGARLYSNDTVKCPFCNEPLKGAGEEFLNSARHLQEIHSLRSIHVGTETIQDHDGRLRQITVATFGRDKLPPLWVRPTQKISPSNLLGTKS
jgi:hypothetical protein